MGSASDDAPVNLDPSARRDLYALVARLFANEMDVDLYRRLVAADDAAAEAAAGLALIDPAVRALNERDAVKALAVEFCRLFIGPRPECLPYASVQRGQALLGGSAASRIEAFMARCGLAARLGPNSVVLTPDHLAVELMLLSRLYDFETSGLAATPTGVDVVEARRELLSDHVLPWAPSFLERVGSCARLEPYPAAARLGKMLLTGFSSKETGEPDVLSTAPAAGGENQRDNRRRKPQEG